MLSKQLRCATLHLANLHLHSVGAMRPAAASLPGQKKAQRKWGALAGCNTSLGRRAPCQPKGAHAMPGPAHSPSTPSRPLGPHTRLLAMIARSGAGRAASMAAAGHAAACCGIAREGASAAGGAGVGAGTVPACPK